jgi:hypothetical protein
MLAAGPGGKRQSLALYVMLTASSGASSRQTHLGLPKTSGRENQGEPNRANIFET